MPIAPNCAQDESKSESKHPLYENSFMKIHGGRVLSKFKSRLVAICTDEILEIQLVVTAIGIHDFSEGYCTSTSSKCLMNGLVSIGTNCLCDASTVAFEEAIRFTKFWQTLISSS